MPSNHFILCRPLLLLPSIFPSIRVFSNESALHIRWPKYWSFSLSISPSNEYSGLVSFRMAWLDLLAAPGTLRSLLQQAQGQPQSRPGHRRLPAVRFPSGRPPTIEGCSQLGQGPQASPGQVKRASLTYRGQLPGPSLNQGGAGIAAEALRWTRCSFKHSASAALEIFGTISETYQAPASQELNKHIPHSALLGHNDPAELRRPGCIFRPPWS